MFFDNNLGYYFVRRKIFVIVITIEFDIIQKLNKQLPWEEEFFVLVAITGINDGFNIDFDALI